MNIAMRKLAMLEKDLIAREERARLEGLSSNPIDSNLKRQIQDLMSKVRVI